MALLVPSFLATYFLGVFALIWFDLHVFDLGDPKLKTSVGIYFVLWSAIFLPSATAALTFLWLAKEHGWRLMRLAGIYLALILAALEVSFVLDANWIWALLELLILAFTFRIIQGMTRRPEYA